MQIVFAAETILKHMLPNKKYPSNGRPDHLAGSEKSGVHKKMAAKTDSKLCTYYYNNAVLNICVYIYTHNGLMRFLHVFYRGVTRLSRVVIR